jgi:protease I
MVKKIALVIAHKNYQPVEYGVPKKVFEDAGHAVITISDKPGKATASDGTTTNVDHVVSKFDPTQCDGIVFIGGQGALDFLDNDASYRFIQKAVMAEKLVAGICSATRILAKAGALAAKTATGWDGDKALAEIFDKHAVIYDDESGVVTDGKLVTAQGPAQAEEFARQILTII